MTPTPWFVQDGAREWGCPAPDGGAFEFHRGLAGYAPTPLVSLPSLAAELGVAHLAIKDESQRFDLRAFKFLGASWAIERAMQERGDAPTVLVTATDGNHGRAVARSAKLRGLPARIYIPTGVPDVVVARILAEGAQLTVVDGDYDEAVRVAAADAESSEDGLLVQDTAWPGYEQIPQWIVDGYETLFREVDDQLGALTPSLVSVPIGVGSLAQATIAHYRSATVRPRLLGVEPETAACVIASLAAGELTSVPTEHTIMNGLNCGTPSLLAWPYLQHGLDAAIGVSDDEAAVTLKLLAEAGVGTGPTGAASFAGLQAVLTDPEKRAALGIEDDAVVVVLNTEGPLT
jgi:diaminopropionate ammonia-lyase